MSDQSLPTPPTPFTTNIILEDGSDSDATTIIQIGVSSTASADPLPDLSAGQLLVITTDDIINNINSLGNLLAELDTPFPLGPQPHQRSSADDDYDTNADDFFAPLMSGALSTVPPPPPPSPSTHILPHTLTWLHRASELYISDDDKNTNNNNTNPAPNFINTHTKSPSPLPIRDEDHVRCGICLDGYETGEDMAVLPCFGPEDASDGHRFHARCVRPWLAESEREMGRMSCPVCRRGLVWRLGRA